MLRAAGTAGGAGAQGRVVGCRFYAQQGTSFTSSERLPPADQPTLEITEATYATADDAHNAVVLAAEAGTNYQLVSIPGAYAAAYQGSFYQADKNQDWICAFAKGTTMVVVKTANVDVVLNPIGIAKLVAPKIVG